MAGMATVQQRLVAFLSAGGAVVLWLWLSLWDVHSALPTTAVWTGWAVWAAGWLVGAWLLAQRARRPLLWTALVIASLAPLYAVTLGREVGAADTFEFQVTAPQLGIAHPTGYPLYLLLGKLWTLLPVGPVAWRLNLASAVYALAALALLAAVVRQAHGRPLAGLAAALLLGLTPTFWSQALEAEVYTLHSLFAAAILWLSLRLPRIADRPSTADARLLTALFSLCGLSLTNHLTTLLLAPAVAIAVLDATRGRFWRLGAALWLRLTAVGLAPLLLYLYLPLRWRAVNGEAMGWNRFWGWVSGQRFAGALQWDLWLRDETRPAIIGRLLRDEWGLWLIVAALGLAALLAQRRLRAAAVLTAVWAAFCFYGLNYTVPDLNVFLLPAHLAIAAAVGSALAVGGQWAAQRSRPLHGALWAVTAVLALAGSRTTFAVVDRSAPNPLLPWARAVLDQPLTAEAAILADSDKFPPLYYLQQAEGVRPDLAIALLPDEAAYRSALEQRLATGQTVYLARYLPRLPYAMRSAGPLVEVVVERRVLPPQPAVQRFGAVALLEVAVGPPDAYGPETLGVWLRWQLQDAPSGDQRIYLLLQGAPDGDQRPSSSHPVNNFYPFAAWRPGEVVEDFHLLRLPARAATAEATLELAVGPPFAAAAALNWRPIARVALSAVAPPVRATATPSAAAVALPPGAVNFDNRIALTQIDRPTSAVLTPGGELALTLHWLALAAPGEDYTVFVQVVDEQDAIWGQVDSWPVQGTFPTSRWAAGQTVRDVVRVPLSAELPPGRYRVYLGWYLLRDLRRLPVLDASGAPVEDKVTLEEFERIDN